MLVIDGEFLGPGELRFTVVVTLWILLPVVGELRIKDDVFVIDGEDRIITWEVDGEDRIEVADGEARIISWADGEALIAGELTRLGRQCLTESEPDWESLLLLGEPGEDTITWRGLRDPGTEEEAATAWGPTRGESGR